MKLPDDSPARSKHVRIKYRCHLHPFTYT